MYIHISVYQYMGGCKKFEEPKLLTKNAFYSRLNRKAIGDQDHQNKKLVQKTMAKMKLGCYGDTYLKADVLLFADIFETF